jgi:hypothetical protein
MLMFLATLSASVAAVLLVQAMDIECVNAPRRRVARSLNAAAKAEASFPNASVAGAMR